MRERISIFHNSLLLILRSLYDVMQKYHFLLLQQKLTEVRDPDHTLITYPDLGHCCTAHPNG